MKKPTGTTYLAIFLGWAILKTLSTIFLRTDSADVLILKNYDLLWLGYIAASVLIILSAASLFAIIKRKKWGVNILYVFFLTSALFTLLIMILGILDFELMKESYTQSRLSRGLHINNIDVIVNPTVFAVIAVLYMGFYGFLGFYVHRIRHYFSK